MKRLLSIFLFICLSSSALAQIKITEMTTYNGNPDGSWVPVVVLGTNRKIDAQLIGRDSIATVAGTTYDTIKWYRNGVYQYFKLVRAGSGGVGGTVTSVAVDTGSAGNNVNISGSPITGAGTITINIPSADTAKRGLITALRQQIGGAKIFTGTYTPSAKLSYNIAALGNHFAAANNDTLVGIEINPIFNALTYTGVLNYGLRSWPLQNLIGPIRTFGSSGNVFIGSNPISASDGGYKLDISGSIRGQLLRLNGPIGYGTNILEFTLNGNTTAIAAINNFGIWNITNGGTNTVAANTGVIGTLGQNTSSLLLGSQINTFGITQWTGTAGTSNHTSLAGPFVIIPNGSGGTFSGLSFGGTKTAGVLSDGYLIALEHWSNSGVLAMGNTTATQKYTVMDGKINVFVDQPNKTLEGYVWRPNITGTVALANNRAFISAPGANHGFGTLTPNNKAIAEFSDTTRGILPTRMTAAQASALSLGTGEAGMYTYVSSTNGTFPAVGFYYWSGTAWIAFSNSTQSGRYWPTYGAVTNVSSFTTLDSAMYTRVGNIVEVTGKVSLNVTTTNTWTTFTISQPIASNFTIQYDAAGVGAQAVGFERYPITIDANGSTDNIRVSYLTKAATGDIQEITFKVSYTIK